MGFFLSKLGFSLFSKDRDYKIVMIGQLTRPEQRGQDLDPLQAEPGPGHPDGAE